MQWEGRFTCWRQISSSSNCWFCLCRVLPRISLLQVGRWQTQKAAAKRKFPLTAAGIGSGVLDWFELILQRFCVLSFIQRSTTIQMTLFLSRQIVMWLSSPVNWSCSCCSVHFIQSFCHSAFIFSLYLLVAVFIWFCVLLYCCIVFYFEFDILIVLIFCSLERYFYRWNSLHSSAGKVVVVVVGREAALNTLANLKERLRVNSGRCFSLKYCT